MKRDRQRPWWVRFALLGLRSRGSVWVCFWASVLITTACLFGGFWDIRLFAGTLLILAAVWYLAALTWVDRYGKW